MVIANRLRNRCILNLQETESALRARGWGVKVVSFEGMSVDEQFKAVQEATTYIGAHGAGLRWGQYLHPRAAMMQLVGFPCAQEVQSKMGFRPRYAIIRSLLQNATTATDFARADHWCRLLATHPIGDKHPIPLSPEDAAILRERNRDGRAHDINIDVDMLIRAVEMLDPGQSPVIEDRPPDFTHDYREWKPITVPVVAGVPAA